MCLPALAARIGRGSTVVHTPVIALPHICTRCKVMAREQSNASPRQSRRYDRFGGETLLRLHCSKFNRICRFAKIDEVQRWLFLDRFSLVLYDYRRWPESAEIQYASEQVRAKVTPDQRYPHDLKFDRASSFRREALIKASNKRVGRPTVRKLISRLLEDAQEFKGQGQFDAYVTNLDVAGKLALEILDDPTRAHEFTQRALEIAAKVTHKWVLQEHYWREADYYLDTKPDSKKKMDSVVGALGVFREHPVVLEPTLGAAGPVPHDPIAELERYGIQEGELRERGVAPSTNPPPEIALRIQRRRLERIVKNLMG